MFSDFFERRRVNRILGRMVNERTPGLAMDGPAGPGVLKVVEFGFVFVLVRSGAGAGAAELVRSAVGAAEGSAVVDVLGPMVVATTGRTEAAKLDRGALSDLVGRLKRVLNGEAKIVYGTGTGYSGLLGSESVKWFSFLLPGFDGILGALAEMDFGEVRAHEPKSEGSVRV